MNSESCSRKVFYADNIDIISTIDKCSVDLIYLDPPFNSSRNYRYTDYSTDTLSQTNKPLAFSDTWCVSTKNEIDLAKYIDKTFIANDDDVFLGFAHHIFRAIFYANRNMLDYLVFLTRRLYLMQDILKQTGSIFLHCDPTASHYIKMIMDAIFGSCNFRNEIVWHYDGPQGPSSKKLSTKHDIILWYVKDIDNAKINKEYLYENIVLDESELKASGYHKDDEGRWFYDLPRGSYTDESIERLEREGRIRYTKNNKVRVKYFLEQDKNGAFVRKKKISDVWGDIVSLGLASSGERNGYPTQKPLSLLERIICITTDEGDTVFDPFLGSGTTIVASEHLGRKWVGVDESMLSMNTVSKRIASVFDYLTICQDYFIYGLPNSRQDFLDLVERGKVTECEHFLLNKLNASILSHNKNQYISGYICGDGDNACCKMPIVINTDNHFDVEILNTIISNIYGEKHDTNIAIGIVVFANIDENIYNYVKDYEQVYILTLDDILLGRTFEKLIGLDYDR